MPKNSQELIQLAGQWANTVKNDIRTQMINFIESSHLTEEQVAEMFAMSMGELDQILRGNGECTITTLTKLLIVTGNTLEIKPIQQSPLGDYGNVNPNVQQPQRQSRPATHRSARPAPQKPSRWGLDSKGRPLPDPEELFGHGRVPRQEPSQQEMDRLLDEYWARKEAESAQHFYGDTPQFAQPVPPVAPVTPAHRGPQRDAHGRFIKRTPANAPVASSYDGIQRPAPQSAPVAPQGGIARSRFDTMTREQLVHLIMENLWDSEIDVQRATIGALRDFLSEKEARLAQRHNPQPAPQPEAKPQSAPANDDISAFVNAMRTFAEQNPQVRDAMRTILG